MFDVWVVFIGRFASKEETGEKFVLSLEEDLGYERIVGRVVGGFIERGDNHCKKVNWIGLLEKNKTFMFMVCHASSTSRLECNNDVQHLYIL